MCAETWRGVPAAAARSGGGGDEAVHLSQGVRERDAREREGGTQQDRARGRREGGTGRAGGREGERGGVGVGAAGGGGRGRARAGAGGREGPVLRGRGRDLGLNAPAAIDIFDFKVTN